MYKRFDSRRADVKLVCTNVTDHRGPGERLSKRTVKHVYLSEDAMDRIVTDASGICTV